jgi:hypothetical protein
VLLVGPIQPGECLVEVAQSGINPRIPQEVT